jgi:ZIP family zinc transporter
MDNLWIALFYATLAGLTIPIGGLLARWESLLPSWLETELRHSVIAFGGGWLRQSRWCLCPRAFTRCPSCRRC